MVFTMKHDAEEYIKDYGLTNAKIIFDKDRFYKVVPEKLENVKLVKSWEELASLNLENENFKVEIESNCCGWINSKKENIYGTYLSTHTFYGLSYKRSTLEFQLRGFMIEIDNWDKGEKL